MKKLIAIITLLFLAKVALAEEYAVVVHPSNADANVKDGFLLSLDSWSNGKKVEPYEIQEAGDLKKLLVKKAFLKEVLGMSISDYNKHWADRKAAGKTTKPAPTSSFSGIKRFVSKKEGGIGYIPKSDADGSVKVVKTFNVN